MALLLFLVVPLLAAGCGEGKDKGVNRDRDRPRSAGEPVKEADKGK
jgi:hypothetical protein